MNYILFDTPNTWQDLLPLTYTRPISKLRIGITTIYEKWNYFLNTQASFLTKSYLQEKYPITGSSDNIFINSSILPNALLVKEINKMPKESVLLSDNLLVACRSTNNIS
ncbi:MAG TPA: glucose-1-phosphate thymidylyltransferase, partial [Bacteroidales bacterium]|nr:glucose-1-phosphate thymidylyltransferase [Bacteroidales bacterium]